ncbi:MAG: lactate utilization protein LutB domain-containing protein, partial [Pyrinomonadaceae bacterium]
LNACPVYQQIGGHAYGSVYPGPIGAVITPQLIGISKAKQLPYASSLCGACRDVCPVKIDIPELLLHLRAEIVDGSSADRKRKVGERLAFKIYGSMWSSPLLYNFGIKAARMMQKLVVSNGRIGKASGFISKLVPALGAWTVWRDAPTIASKSFREQWKEGLRSK